MCYNILETYCTNLYTLDLFTPCYSLIFFQCAGRSLSIFDWQSQSWPLHFKIGSSHLDCYFDPLVIVEPISVKIKPHALKMMGKHILS